MDLRLLPPSVFVFNAFSEGHIARGKGFAPTKYQVMLAEDLANLPQFLCRPNDIVLVEKCPTAEFLNTLRNAGIPSPEFVQLNRGRLPPDSDLGQRLLGDLRPWAWGPDSVELLRPLFARASRTPRIPSRCFNNDIADLYSKVWSAAFLRRVLAHVHADAGTSHSDVQDPSPPESDTGESWLCPAHQAGVAVDTIDSALDAIASIRRRGHHRVVAKQALGLAGHNSIRLWETDVSAAQRRWLARTFSHGGQVVIEPWLERELDFSVQLEMGAHRLRVCGYTGLVVDHRGQYLANWAAADYSRRIPASVARLLGQPPDISLRLDRLYHVILGLLESELRRIGFVGPISIDAFVYRTPQGDCRLKPIVEINPRYTMGRLTVELMKRTCPGSVGLFRLVSLAQARAGGDVGLSDYAQRLIDRSPLHTKGNATPRIREGAICLNDAARAQACLATFEVSRDPSREGCPCHFYRLRWP